MFLESFFSSVLSGIVLRILDFKKKIQRRKVKKVKHDKKLINRISKKVIKYLETRKFKNKQLIKR